MPVLLRTELPASYVPYIRDKIIPRVPWHKYILNVHTPRSYVHMNTVYDPNTCREYRETVLYGFIDFSNPGDWKHTFYHDSTFHDYYYILKKKQACICLKYDISHQSDADLTFNQQPELWVRSDNLAEFLGGVGPKVHMPPEILADWLEDRMSTPREIAIVKRIRSLIESRL